MLKKILVPCAVITLLSACNSTKKLHCNKNEGRESVVSQESNFTHNDGDKVYFA